MDAMTAPGQGDLERPAAGRLLSRSVRSLLRVRLFYKILIANAALIVLATLGGAGGVALWLNGTLASELAGVLAAAALCGIGASVALNAFILRIALRPYGQLERAAEAVLEGRDDVRAPLSPLADANAERLIRTFNGMLDKVLLYRRRLRILTRRTLGAAEEERRRLARDLQEETAQTLATLLLRLKGARAEPDPETRERRFDELRGDMADLLDDMRRMAQGLRPQALDLLGLVPAIERFARDLEETSGLRVHVRADGLEPPLPPRVELALYRIVQEALTNVSRHAETCRAALVLRGGGDRVHVTVEDGGRGFVVADVLADPDRGLGLFGMQERALEVRGRLRVDSRVGYGTRVEVDVPLTREEGVEGG